MLRVLYEYNVHYYCRSILEPADSPTLSIPAITATMHEAQLIVFFLSADFAKNEQCVRIFMFVRESLKKLVQVVIVGNDSDLFKSDIGLKITGEVSASHVLKNVVVTIYLKME